MAKQQTKKTTFLYPNIRKKMAVKGLSIGKLSQRLGVGTSTLRNKLSGETKFYLDEARLLSNILETELEALFKTE